MEFGERGKKLIKSYETLRLQAYMPTPNDRPTIGWGYTKGIKMGDTCTVEQAERWFLEDTAEAVEAVSKLADRMQVQQARRKLTQSMFDALVSLAFNAGAGAVASTSTIGAALVLGEFYIAWAGFTLWRKQAKKDLRGLALRRSKEMALFLEDRF